MLLPFPNVHSWSSIECDSRFVTYGSVQEAEKAIKTYNRFKFGGKYNLRVSLARNSGGNTMNGSGVEQIWKTAATSEDEKSVDNQSKASR